MTELEAINFINNIIKTLNKDGFLISLNDIAKITFAETDGAGGMTLAERRVYNLIFNNKLLQENKLPFLQCTIYHELAHVIQYNEAFDAKIIEFDEASNEIYSITINNELAINTIFGYSDHTLLWENIVKELNNRYNIRPPVVAYLSQADLQQFLEEFFMPNTLRKKAAHIDYTINGLTIDDMMRYNVKQDNTESGQVNEGYIVKHAYRDLTKHNK